MKAVLRSGGLPLGIPGRRFGILFGPVPFPLAVATYSFSPDAEGRNTIDMGIHSVGTNPIGSTIPCFDAFSVSFLVSITAMASLTALATYRRLPSALTARASGSAPK